MNEVYRDISGRELAALAIPFEITYWYNDSGTWKYTTKKFMLNQFNAIQGLNPVLTPSIGAQYGFETAEAVGPRQTTFRIGMYELSQDVIDFFEQMQARTGSPQTRGLQMTISALVGTQTLNKVQVSAKMKIDGELSFNDVDGMRFVDFGGTMDTDLPATALVAGDGCLSFKFQ